MPNLLHLDSSAGGNRSRSRALTATFAREWQAGGDDFVVTYRDLHANPVPHLPDAALHWAPRLRPADASPPPAAEALQQELLAELLAADALVIGSPLYNYTVPSALKAWLDHIHVPGTTAPFDTTDQPMAGRPAVILSARGGSYDEGSPTEGWDHGIPVLSLLLAHALGMVLTVVTTSLTLAEDVALLAPQLERSRAELAAAQEAATAAARELVASFG